MQIMFWLSDSKAMLFVIALCMGGLASASGYLEFSWVETSAEHVELRGIDDVDYTLQLAAEVKGVFLDKRKHLVNGVVHVAVFQVIESNPGKPLGFCGAGNEMWLHVYEVREGRLLDRDKILVNSCLQSISLASQNTGEVDQDMDFSSLVWNATGFSISWFDRWNSEGRLLARTNYLLEEGTFVAEDILD